MPSAADVSDRDVIQLGNSQFAREDLELAMSAIQTIAILYLIYQS